MHTSLRNGVFAALLIPTLWLWHPSYRVQAADDAVSPDCTTAVEQASKINAFALLSGAVSCAREGQREETNFLTILGQIRGLTDLTVLAPADDGSALKAAQLYQALYSRFGGLGYDEVYREPSTVSRLEARIRATDLSFSSDYDPGWSYGPTSKTDVYAEVVTSTRNKRVWQMLNAAARLQDDAYYEVYTALADLKADNPAFEYGTPAYDEFNRLTARLGELAESIPRLPEPEDTMPHARLNEVDPETAARQVASGFNGPASSSTDLLRSEEELRGSWLAVALPAEEFQTLIADTDFTTHYLVVFSFGKRMNASGELKISELAYHSLAGGYTITTRIGVVAETCGIPFTESFPFVVGVVEAVANAGIRGSGSSNFGAECGPIVSGKAVSQP